MRKRSRQESITKSFGLLFLLQNCARFCSLVARIKAVTESALVCT